MMMNEYEIIILGCKKTISSVDEFRDKVNDFAQKNQFLIQLMDAEQIVGKEHLLSAFEHALRSFHRNEAATRSLEMELLLYAAGERQIKHAIQKMGIKKNKNTFAAILLYNKKINQDKETLIDLFITTFNITRDDSILFPTETKLRNFGITNKAIKSVKKEKMFHMILERIALVDIIKK
jgi:KEOPS complex subunit Cgi121